MLSSRVETSVVVKINERRQDVLRFEVVHCGWSASRPMRLDSACATTAPSHTFLLLGNNLPEYNYLSPYLLYVDTMEDLPAELLELIARQCEHASRKNLRGVNSELREASTPGVFQDFYSGLFSRNLHHLSLLSKSSLAKHVRTFTFYDNALPEWDESTWERSINDEPKRELQVEDMVVQWPDVPVSRAVIPVEELARHSFSKKQLEDGWLEFRRLRKDQQNWRRNGRSLQFKEYFAALPNVQEATVLTAVPQDGDSRQMPVWKGLRSRILVSPRDWMQDLYSSSTKQRADISSQAFLCLLEAIGFRASFSGSHPVTTLSLRTSHHGPWPKLMGAMPREMRDNGLPAIDYKMRYQMILEGFSHFTDVDLGVYNDPDESHVSGDDIGKEVADLLRAAKGLKRLQLVYRDDMLGRVGFEPLLTAPPLTPIFTAAPPWRQLEGITLSVDMPHLHILDLLRHVSTSLQSLELRAMAVGDAHELFLQIPKVVKLQRIYLQSIWAEDSDAPVGGRFMLQGGIDADEPYERAMKAYLLGQQDEFPGLEFDEQSDDLDEGIEEDEYMEGEESVEDVGVNTSDDSDDS